MREWKNLYSCRGRFAWDLHNCPTINEEAPRYRRVPRDHCGRLLPGVVTSAQDLAPTSQIAAQPGVTIEQVIVTGSNIPTAEETGPNPVDTYRPADLEKLGVRNTTDLTTFLPQEAGGTVNLNIGNGGDGTVQFNLRGFLPKETLVLVDGKRVAFGSLGVAGASRVWMSTSFPS